MALSAISGGSETCQLFSLAQAAHMDKSDADQASRIFKDKDTDNSGGLSLEEMGGNQALFDLFDTDKDGVVSPAELQAGLKKYREEAKGQADAGMEQNALLAQVQAGMSGSGEGPEAQMASDLLGAYDGDADGSLNAEELGMTAGELAAYDTNGDGALNAQELAAGLKADKEAMLASSAPPPPPPGETDADTATTLADAAGDGAAAETDPMDTNKDGVVSTEEYEAWMTEHGFTLGADSAESGSDSTSRTLLSKALEAYRNQSAAFLGGLFNGDSLVDQTLFNDNGLGLSASA